ncbi:MAG: hypothetical protein JXR76_06995 [Deltaproteobacteria bacterium]|nr:hypothetical protein [Deltaproteobacteria bacterium]
MKKVFALVFVSLFALVIGCGGSQPAADTTTVDESATVIPDANAGDAAGNAEDMAQGASLDATADAASEAGAEGDAAAATEGDAASADDEAAGAEEDAM